ncbi:hypothetical protein ABE488_00685 [Luteimonas sp. TWI662]|uniref:hypothetical protein n=1 Tax=Luteimonas sp. TWI662 TaxID=3136789 RepID=UPI0032087FC7
MANFFDQFDNDPPAPPRGQLAAGNIDLNSRPVVRNADGTISTVRSMSTNIDGREVLIPTVSDDGRVLGDDEAVDTYMRTGRHLGQFATPEDATSYAQQLHVQQERRYGGNFFDQFDDDPQAPPLEIDIVGGTPVAAAEYAAGELGAPKSKGPALGDRVRGELRGLGLGARSVLQGAGGLFGALGGDFVNAALIPGEQASYRDAAGGLADFLGLPSPQDGRERVLGDVGEALTGTGLTLGVGGIANAGRSAVAAPSMRAALGDLLTAQPALQTVSAATGAAASGATREGGGGAGAQIAAGLAGGLAPSAALYGTPMAIRGAVRGGESNRRALESAIEDFAALGDATPTIGQGTGSRMRQAAENLLGSGPTSAGVMARAGELQGQRIGSGLDSVARRLSADPTPEGAGASIQRGVAQFNERTRETGRSLYRAVDEAVPSGERVTVSNTQAALSELNEAIEGAPNVGRFFQNARIQGIERALLDDTDGTLAALTRPEVRREAEAIRQRLQDQANLRRAEIAEQSSEMRQELLTQNAERRTALTAEADRLRNRIHDAVENRRNQLYREADELELRLRSEQRAAIEENRRRAAFPETRSQVTRVITDEEIARQVPTRAQIDAQLPKQADIDAQVPTARDIDNQLLSEGEINRRVPTEATWSDPKFGSDYIEKEVNRYLQSQVDGKLPYEALTKLRTLVGNEIDNYSLVDNVPRSKWKALYGALTRDMEAAANTPEAQRAWRLANRYHRIRIRHLEQIEHVVDKNGGPERVFQAAMQGTREGATVLRSVMRALPEDAQRDVTGAVIKRMGRANPGMQGAGGDAFSAATFLTNWNKLSPEARATLFNRFGPDISEDIDRIARVAGTIKEGTGVLRNPSGTGAQVAAFGYGGTLATSAMTGNFSLFSQALASGAIANAFARAMTNRYFVRWFARTTEMPVGALPAQLNVLKRMAAENDDEDIATVAEALEANATPQAEEQRNQNERGQ